MLLLRAVLALRADTRFAAPFSEIPAAFAAGLAFDVVTASYFCLPLALYLAFLPERVARWRWHAAMFVAASLLRCRSMPDVTRPW